MRPELVNGLPSYIQSQPQQTPEVAEIVKTEMLAVLDSVEQALETGHGDRAVLRQDLKTMEKSLRLIRSTARQTAQDMSHLVSHGEARKYFIQASPAPCELHGPETDEQTAGLNLPQLEEGEEVVLPDVTSKHSAKVVSARLELGQESLQVHEHHANVPALSTPGLDSAIGLMANGEPVLRALLSDRLHDGADRVPDGRAETHTNPTLIEGFKYIKTLRNLVEGMHSVPGQTFRTQAVRSVSGSVSVQYRHLTWKGLRVTVKTFPLSFHRDYETHANGTVVRTTPSIAVTPAHLEMTAS
jgi:hypothetical protein